MKKLSYSFGVALPLVLVIVAVIAIVAIIAVPKFFFDKSRSVDDDALREEEPAVSTYEMCVAQCRDQYGGSGSVGFDACVRACGATRGLIDEEDEDSTAQETEGSTTSTQPPPPAVADEPTPPPAQSSSPPPPPPEPATSVSVNIQNFAFSPKTTTIAVNGSVTFTNLDSVGHTATQDGGGFDTGLLAQNASKTLTFTTKGTFTYHCTPHPSMTGTIIVE